MIDKRKGSLGPFSFSFFRDKRLRKNTHSYTTKLVEQKLFSVFGALNNGHFFQHEIEMKIKAFASLIVGVFQNEFKITEKMRFIFVENRFVE